jgi:hypothetical protein
MVARIAPQRGPATLITSSVDLGGQTTYSRQVRLLIGREV